MPKPIVRAVVAAVAVVGIDTAGSAGRRVETTKGGEGFAIPIDEALQIARQWLPR